MIENGGQLAGGRILSPQTVVLMSTNQVGTPFDSAGTAGQPWLFNSRAFGSERFRARRILGLGRLWQRVRSRSQRAPVLVFMMNQLPNSSGINQKWMTLVYQALVEPAT